MHAKQASYHSDSPSQTLSPRGFETPAYGFHLTQARVDHHVSGLAEQGFHCSVLDITVLQKGKGPIWSRSMKERNI